MKQNNAKGCLISIVIVVIILAGGADLITTSEAFPGTARFAYDNSLKIIVPAPAIGLSIFYPVLERSAIGDNGSWDGTVTWKEMQSNTNRWGEYKLPKGPGWDKFTFYGEPIPLWKNLLFRPLSRWDEDGNWRY